MKDDFWFFAMLNISFALSLDSIDCSTFPVHTYILTPFLSNQKQSKKPPMHRYHTR